ncbi:hypothetical protein [Nostoc sp.]|uniref:hypothetical protein n=1 Tax=Nostoc sp. TaxID=1180 RepID=UPI003FA5DFB1
MKTPEQVVAELDAMRQSGNLGAVYFVDDNFVGDRRAAMRLLPHLIDWQKITGYLTIICTRVGAQHVVPLG